jgi:hypothetical protein
MKSGRIMTRRDFLRGTACGAAGLAFGLEATSCAREREPAVTAERMTAPATTRVVLVRDTEALDAGGRINGPVVTRMLDDAVCALFDSDSPARAWQSILEPDDILGVKSNVWGSLPTPPELEQAIAARALERGIREDEISIRDRGILDDRVFREATALINIRPLRTHHWSGIGGCIKNYIMFVREPWKWHDDSCADLGGLWNLPIVKGKTRLNVLVVLTPLFYGIGPHHFDPNHVWPYGGLLVGTDPVALDALGVKLLSARRREFFERPPRGGTSTKHVPLAETRHGAGIADLERIELIRIGPMEGALI